MARFDIRAHDSHPAEETAAVDAGLGADNDRAAPLHEVQPLACFARDGAGRLVGGAVGRRWGGLCELQQLWVDERQRRQGLGSALVRAFESHALRHGCTLVYLETLSFQAPALYRRLGYRVEFLRRGFPHGIVKYHLARTIGPAPDPGTDQARLQPPAPG